MPAFVAQFQSATADLALRATAKLALRARARYSAGRSEIPKPRHLESRPKLLWTYYTIDFSLYIILTVIDIGYPESSSSILQYLLPIDSQWTTNPIY